jgi:hypothetical protein
MTGTADNDTPNFDPTRTIALYRNIVEERNAASDDMEKAELDRLAQLLRDAWKDLHGKDSLHDTAFGDPAEREPQLAATRALHSSRLDVALSTPSELKIAPAS